MTDVSSHPAVAVIGAAVAGAQVARILADRGAEVVVFEQNDRPFGKIEDGLPRWHSGLRKKEFARILGLLEHPRIHFVPRTRIGSDVDFGELVEGWGFSAVVLANGVWRDRPLPVPGAETYLGRGLVYQNPFIVAFNHANDPGYSGPQFDVPDGAIVVGGGLASIDVVKVLMLENARKKLAERGHEVDLEELEKAGIPKTCEALGFEMAQLGLAGATLVYRRRADDMPVAEAAEGADEARLDKVRASRRKILERAIAKYGFRFEPLSAPEAPIEEDGRLVGLRLRRLTTTDGRKLEDSGQTYELRGSMVISSIGSIPEPIPGIAMKGELFAFTDWDFGRLDGLPTVWSAGNVVTGKGNIVASRRHANLIGEHVASAYLGLEPADGMDLGAVARGRSTEQAELVAEAVVRSAPPVSDTARAKIIEQTRSRQAAVGYGGELGSWVERHPPAL